MKNTDHRVLKSLVAMLALTGVVTTSHRDAKAADTAAPVMDLYVFNSHILVDQFGYLPQGPKVAVIRNPNVGFDRERKFAPGPQYQLRRTEDGAVVFDGPITPWKQGATEASSGDNGWWFDFSSVETPGRYFVFDVQNKVRSAGFQINEHVYHDVLKAAMRTYFYQRSGFAKSRPFADACWVDDVTYAGPGQDTQAHDVTDRANAQKVRNLSGGWFDAGDTNKYVTFAAEPVHQLLSAYQENPKVFTDDFNIPESGNGIPDVLDEVAWEISWLQRMQYPDGSAALKVGEIDGEQPTPPSMDHNARFYVPSCSSATIAVAGMLAHASLVFSAFPNLKPGADELLTHATAAWRNFQALKAKQTHCDTGVVHAGIADWTEQDQLGEAVVAAVYLFAKTGDPTYSNYIKANLHQAQPYHDFGWSRYKPEHGEALLFYTSLPTADPALKSMILQDKLADVKAGNGVYGFDPADDLYRDFLTDPQYHWGSNKPRANSANSNLDVVTYHLDDSTAARVRAMEALHYFHGVNPLGMVYLSNMSRYGATKSATQIYHTWFAAGSRWGDAANSTCGPAPGYVPGGPNASAVHDGVPATVVPPANQPPQKSYRDWNAVWPDSSWAITEPGIYYQSAYIKLLSKFVQ